MGKRKPLVWYVDDLPSNLREFAERHSQVFTVRPFAKPAEVLEALKGERPDALVCDIFFYESPEIAADMERRVQDKARELRAFGAAIGANKEMNRAGIELIQTAARRYGERFPIYAFTSKGPYLLDDHSFERIAESGAKWLFKGKYGATTEQLILCRDIETFRLKNSWTLKLARYFWAAAFGSGVLGGLVVWLLTEFLPRHWHAR
jgi:hypothetical protein